MTLGLKKEPTSIPDPLLTRSPKKMDTPAAESETQAARHLYAVSEDGSPSATEASALKLLLVDDDIVDRKTIRRLFNSRNHRYIIHEAKSRNEAMEACQRENYACILLDFNLGESDALELLPLLRNFSEDGRQAIVLITGMGNEYLAAKAFKAGVHDYIVKSNLHADILFGAVEHAVHAVDLERNVEKQRAELEYFGLHDHLTGLPNRKLFFDRLEQALLHGNRNSTKFSICSVDLDRFKQINDTLGHEAGDEVIKEVGRRLTQTLRSTDTIARFGGDEFVALIEVLDYEDAVAVADKLIDVVHKPIHIDDLQVGVGLSVGISNFPKNGTSGRELLKKADAAMYEAKNSSRGVIVYSNSLIPGDDRAVSIATEISAIIDNDTLEMEYQPQVNLLTNEIIGVEALVRWRHPALGLLPPVEFIPAVERTQKITPITFHITNLVIKQCASWLASGFEMPVAVNLSAKILDNPELPDKIMEMLERSSLPPSLLTLEVTETGALASQQLAAGILRDLAKEGVKISIDDFGSGYTSFRYLRDFVIHELKIDRMFIDDLVQGDRNESIVKSMLELGKGFGVNVVAEGIENLETLEKLKAMECGSGQGYFFSRPMSPNKLLAWSADWALKNKMKT